MADNNKKRILIIEDDELMQNALKGALVKEDFDVTVSSDGKEGVEMALRTRPDVIILDILLPKALGTEVVKEIKIQQPDLINRIIVMTSAMESQYLADSMESGISTYVIKGEHELKDIVKKVKEKLGI